MKSTESFPPHANSDQKLRHWVPACLFLPPRSRGHLISSHCIRTTSNMRSRTLECKRLLCVVQSVPFQGSVRNTSPLPQKLLSEDWYPTILYCSDPSFPWNIPDHESCMERLSLAVKIQARWPDQKACKWILTWNALPEEIFDRYPGHYLRREDKATVNCSNFVQQFHFQRFPLFKEWMNKKRVLQPYLLQSRRH